MIASSTSTPATIIEINSALVRPTSAVVSFDGIMCRAAAAKRATMSLFETSISCKADSSAYSKAPVE